MNLRVGLPLPLRILLASFIAMILLLAPRSAWSTDLSNSPLLQMNSWMHTGDITQLALDGSSRYLVSSSKDKTVRVWEVATHRLMFVLRPPVGPGKEGILNSVAISPDGQTVAVGGYTKGDKDSYSVYLFDLFSRKLVRSLPGQRSPIHFLTYSPDGNFLVVLMGKGTGLRIYRTSDLTLAVEDSAYDNKCYWAAFDRDGRLVTSCMDGFLRLYNSSFKLIVKRRASGGDEPFAVAFSPDNKQISVGFTDSTKIDVLSSSDLNLLYSPDTHDVKNGNLSGTTWSADGQVLYAGGRFKVSDDSWAIRYWVEAGRGKAFNVAAARNTISDIRQLSTGGIAFSSLEPSIGFMDITARTSFVRDESGTTPLPHPDFRAIGNKFLVSDTGESIGFAYKALGKDISGFSVFRRTFKKSLKSESRLSPPIQKATGLMITDWDQRERPKLAGITLQIESQETSRSVAISPDHEAFVLGADWNIYLFDRTGRRLWQTPTQSPVWGVNLTGNGKLVVGALGDGTIRWYRHQDGKELLALFPHPDRNRWILWSPSGYYDVSLGGEDLIGWHVNQGWDKAADFFPIKMFRDNYLRPDVIKRILDTADESEAIRFANEKAEKPSAPLQITAQLPPIVQIYTSQHTVETKRTVATTEVTVRFGVRSESAVTKFRVLIDSVPVTTKPPYAEAQQLEKEVLWNVVVSIPQRDVQVAVIAENESGPSQPATVTFQWDGKSSKVISHLYLLAIGVREFSLKKQIPGLLSADQDAMDVAATFNKQKGRLYENVTPMVLTNRDATKAAVQRGIEWLLDKTEQGDYAILFLSGHGTSGKNEQYYFVPYDFNPSDTFSVTGLGFAEILDNIARVRGQVIVMIDTCRSATLFGSNEDSYILGYTRAVNALVNPKGGRGITVFASVTDKGLAREDNKNGYFTSALKAGLEGAAIGAWTDGEVTVTRLEDYISTIVKNRTYGVQKPTALKSGPFPDFALALK